MSPSQDRPERRQRNLRDTRMWERDLNGYAICPWCAAMVYADRTDFHQEHCGAAQAERRTEEQRP